MYAEQVTIKSDAIALTVSIDEDGAAYLDQIIPRGSTPRWPASKYFKSHHAPLVEVRLAGEGTQKHKSSKSLLGSYIGARLRCKFTEIRESEGSKTLDVTLSDLEANITVISHLTIYDSTPTLRATATIRNDSGQDIIVTQVTSLVLGGLTTGSAKWWHDYMLSVPTNSWFREAQWIEHGLPSVGVDHYGVYGRPENHFASLAHYPVSNRGTFSTEGHLPMGSLKHRNNGETWLWQVENNGSWRWEIGDWRDSVYLAAGGPIETDHGWRQLLRPSEEFATVPVALVHVYDDYEKAFSALTRYRRIIRRKHNDNLHLPIVFNDYMNCLMGDPTEEKILALVGPVVKAGAEYFVIDCGWYADDAGWWDDVGAWEPSKKRFPNGFNNLLTQIRRNGLIPGLWIEPEVIGVRSKVAAQLPDEAFFQRDGHRVVEKGRYQLDYRHPAVRSRMHGIVERFVEEFGVGYFKFDYNIDVTQGTDVGTSSPGSGQLEHNRAYLTWVNELLDKFPSLVIENCSSGGQRMDYAMLSTHPIQSSSDQQDPDKYAAISATLPTAVTPEQGAVWTNAFSVVNALLGRVHLSGRLVKEGMDIYKTIRGDLPAATAFWPLGLPGWHDGWVALGMAVDGGDLESVELPLPALKARDVTSEWDVVEGALRLTV
ncbi:glycoside hydrolase superfamily [Aspergillus recurvatus]